MNETEDRPQNGAGTRLERDSLGEREVPADVYYGIQTLRALENFPISGLKPHYGFIWATAVVKRAAAEANLASGPLDPRIGKAIVQAAQEVIDGLWHDQFVVDVFQAGAGTSHHMNANEVLANRAIEILGGRKGDYSLAHPNDHVNMSQSTNDVFPTSMRLASLLLLDRLYASMEDLGQALEAQGTEFSGVVKSGRTHLQDAVPVTLGQEFQAYARSVRKGEGRIKEAAQGLLTLNIGATAAGTGLNANALYRPSVIERLKALTGYDLRGADDLMEATQSTSDFAHVSSALKTFALDLIRISNDLRLLGSGPRTGLGEINLPPVQPGSSIMPGKVNPVIAEVTDMVCFQVAGNDLTIAMAVQAGQLELNVMMPVIAFNLLQSIEILKNVCGILAGKCVRGITANVERCRDLAERSLGMATVLNPH
ncbi:MAG: aspartate ammonia-lyase, partial [Dehalococcoidia bacterium]|nr:aspartate ammonia-lyase [Dehalococcoidia bacterium]